MAPSAGLDETWKWKMCAPAWNRTLVAPSSIVVTKLLELRLYGLKVLLSSRLYVGDVLEIHVVETRLELCGIPDVLMFVIDFITYRRIAKWYYIRI